MDWREFEEFARATMSKHLDVELTSRKVQGHPKHFDLVSHDGSVVGDAKFLTLVHGKGLPPAKFMEIAGHVWLLEQTPANRRFLVFGNQRRVAEWWLEKYGCLNRRVEFYFLAESGAIDLLSHGAEL